MHAFSIHKASVADIPLIRRMADVVFRRTYRDILSPAQMEYMMDMMYSEDSLRDQIQAPGKEFFIAYSGDPVSARTDRGDIVWPPCVHPAGYLSFEEDGCTENGLPRYHLQKLYILPEYQHAGLGRQMLEFVKDRLTDVNPEGCRIELNVNRANPATGFYERMGMVRDRQGDFPIGNGFFMNDYIYILDLLSKTPDE